MRTALATLVLGLVLLGLAGCGNQSEETPSACLSGKAAYLSALRRAPGEVRIGGEAELSECLAENQQGGDLANVGEAMVGAATQLNAEARQDPGGEAAVRLGYLLGAAERGAEGTEGIHADLIRRLTVAARYSPEGPLPAPLLAAYKRGFDAGHAGG